MGWDGVVWCESKCDEYLSTVSRALTNVGLLSHELAEVAQVDEGGDDGVVDRPEKVEGGEELHNPHVHRDEVTHVHLAFVVRFRRKHQGHGEAAVHDDLCVGVGVCGVGA